MKRLLSMILAICMVLSLCLMAACTPAEQDVAPAPAPDAAADPAVEPEAAPEPEAEPEETAEIAVILWANGAPPAPEALALVNEKLNELTIPAINVKVDVQIWDVGTYIGTAATAVGAGDNIDLMCTFAAAAPHFASMSAQNMLQPLDDLLQEYCPDILKLIPESWWPATSKDGKIVGVPVYANKSNNYGITFVKEWLDETGFKAEDIKTLDDIHAVLTAFHEKHPDKIALSGDNLTLDATYPGFDFVNASYYDQLGDNTSVAVAVPFTSDGTTDYKAVSRYETEGFEAVRKALQTWYNEGLIDKDAFSYNGNGFTLSVNENVFAGFSVATPTMKANRLKATKHECVDVELMPGVVSTSALNQFTWAIPTSCDEPEAAAKFMNMLYSVPAVYNLICFGVEGEHYVLNADGQMELPEGMTSETSPYYPNCFNFTGNTILGNTWAGSDPALPAKEEAAIKSSIVSPLLGFTFDQSAISDSFALLGQIAHDEYGPFIFTGAATDAQFEEFIAKMYENGLQAYIDEAQKQIDAWVAANK